MDHYNTIEIIFKDGHSVTWRADGYAYDGRVFIVRENGSWVRIYNIDNVISVVVK